MSKFTEDLLELESKDLPSTFEEKCHGYKPLVYKRDFVYIVSAVLIEEDRILLISESKSECYGQWYLPAGRVNKNENFEAACKRELLEESFIEGEADHLLSVNFIPAAWFRFNFIVHQVGGRLKTLQDKDKESLEARWFPITEVVNKRLNLRCDDIIPVINDAVTWLANDRSIKHLRSLPIHTPHSQLIQRLFVVDSTNENGIAILIEKNTKRFPMEPFNIALETVKPIGLLSIEHYADQNTVSDGICFNFLCETKCDDNYYDEFDWLDGNFELLKTVNLIKHSGSLIIKN